MITLKEILAIQTESGQEWRMFARIIRELSAMDGVHYTSDHLGNIYAQKGCASSYPCVVAHMDSVHDIVEDLHVLEFNGLLTGFNRHTMKQTGIGGDDKVGIYIALKCLEKFDTMKVAFFVAEEVGCVGSGECDMTFFNDCRFVLQADRRGSKDFITTAGSVELSGKEFQNAVQKYTQKRGFSFTTGMMTDVQELKRRGLPVACANVSCGYHRPHQADEFVVVRQVENTLALFRDIIGNCTDVYKHTYKPVQTYTPKWTNDFADWNKPTAKAVQSTKAVQSPKMEQCDCCMASVYYVKWSAQYNIFMCDACTREYA
jgi:putative aminopeptidase FrvX